MTASAIAYGLREGSVELGRDLLPQDLETLLREPRFRAGLVETPKKGTYFVLFNCVSGSSLGSNPTLRRALAGATRSQDFVWGALGRFALPSMGVIPPGILGHDPGRRRPHLAREKALAMLESAGATLPVRLKASVHPILQDRFRALTSALFGIWRDLGVEVDVVTPTMAEYLESQRRAEVDVLIGRWMADYDDPDDFTFSLFNSGSGLFRGFFSSPEVDRLLTEARVEIRPPSRETVYRRFEQLLVDEAVLIPLFHEVDYRIAGPGVKGVKLSSSPPFVSYAEIARARVAEEAPREWAGGVLHVPIAGTVQSIDPAFAAWMEQGEVLPNVFEPLTRDIGGARVVPWLAAEVRPENGLTRFRFHLRPSVRFHDGRTLTARDVRFSFERLLQNPEGYGRSLLSAIRGARRLIDGEAGELEGFRILSPSEFTIDLERPVSFFPVLVSFPGTAVLPEGTGTLGESWRRGCVGTGPFRVTGFQPGQRLELQRNPDYWREGYPKSEGLVFRFGISPEEIKSEFLAGRLAIASDLLPKDADELRHDPRFRSGYQETPRLVTYYVAFNAHRGVLADVKLRRTLTEGIDVAGIVRRTLPRLALPATGLIPPGLLGHSATVAPKASRPVAAKENRELTALVHPAYFGEYSAFTKEVLAAFHEMGFTIRVVNKTMGEFTDGQRKGETDLCIGRWIGDYADADTFVYGLLHSQEAPLGLYCGGPEIDELAGRGRAEIEPRIRDSIYREVEEILARDALLIPLFHEQAYRFARPEVEGLSVGFSYPVVAYENLWMKR
jgi:ABC-type transport system substrate-binding protein